MSRDPWHEYARIRTAYKRDLDQIDRCDRVGWWLGVALAVMVAAALLAVASAVA